MCPLCLLIVNSLSLSSPLLIRSSTDSVALSMIAERGGDADISKSKCSAALFGLPAAARVAAAPLSALCHHASHTVAFRCLGAAPRCRLPCHASVAMGADGRVQSRLCKNRRHLKPIWIRQMAQAGVEERKLFTITKFTGDPDCLSSNRGA